MDIELEIFRLEFMAEVADRVAEGRRANGLDASEAEEQAWWFRREAEMLDGTETGSSISRQAFKR